MPPPFSPDRGKANRYLIYTGRYAIISILLERNILDMDEYMAVGDHELDDFADREEITEELEALFEIAVDFSEGR